MLRTSQIPHLSGQLSGVDSGYRSARPCMTALLDRIIHINATVVELPGDIAVRLFSPEKKYVLEQ